MLVPVVHDLYENFIIFAVPYVYLVLPAQVRDRDLIDQLTHLDREREFSPFTAFSATCFKYLDSVLCTRLVFLVPLVPRIS